jgi:urease accessory protein
VVDFLLNCLFLVLISVYLSSVALFLYLLRKINLDGTNTVSKLTLGSTFVLFITVLFLILTPSDAFAHHAEWMTGRPFIQGLSMPIHGVDHLLVTLGVGLIAVQLGGEALWAVPGAFGLLMLIGGLLNVNGIAVPFLEQWILASVLVLGAILALRQPLPFLLSLIVVGVFAAIQGNALMERDSYTVVNWSFPLFSAGCLISAFAVLAGGMAIGFVLQRFYSKRFLRYAGFAIIIAGIVIYLLPGAIDVIIHLLEGAKR